MSKGRIVALALIGFPITVSACEGERGPTGLEGPAGPPYTVSESQGCARIQEAIDSLPTAGGQIVVQAGDYWCDTPIIIDRDNVDLRGQGAGTVLHLNDGTDSPVIVLGDTTGVPIATRANLHVSDLVIDGNRENQTMECWGGPCAAYPIRNNGITIRKVSDVLVERVTVHGARSGGLVVELGSRRVTVREFTSYDNHFDGLAGYNTTESRFSGLYLYNNCAAGLSFDSEFDNNMISDVVIARDASSSCAPPLEDGKVGVFMRYSRDNVFSDLQIRNTREHGIFLAQVDADQMTAASGNTFSGLVVSGSNQAGLWVNDPSVLNTLVVESQFVGNADGCIREAFAGQVQQIAVICR